MSAQSNMSIRRAIKIHRSANFYERRFCRWRGLFVRLVASCLLGLPVFVVAQTEIGDVHIAPRQQAHADSAAQLRSGAIIKDVNLVLVMTWVGQRLAWRSRILSSTKINSNSKSNTFPPKMNRFPSAFYSIQAPACRTRWWKREKPSLAFLIRSIRTMNSSSSPSQTDPS